MDTPLLIKRRTMEQEEEKSEGQKVESRSNSQRLLRVDQIYSRRDRQTHFVKTAKSSLKSAQHDRFNKTVLLVRRIISRQGMVAETKVDIKSTLLKDVLLEIFNGAEGLELHKSPPVADPELLYHAVGGLNKRMNMEKAQDTSNKSLIDDISTAIDFVRDDFASQIPTIMSLSEHGEITYDLLWVLFPPKEVIFTKANIMMEPQALEFRRGHYGQRADRSEYYGLGCRIISHDGENLGYGKTKLEIDKFEGSKKIYTLSAFPLSAHLENERVRAQLLERGRQYMRQLGQSCKDYQGIAVEEKYTPERRATQLKYNATGRVMLDPVTFRQHNPDSGLLRPWVDVNNEPTRFKEDELLLCNHCVPGFSFAKKAWGIFAISAVSDVVWDEAAFSKLVIDPKRRDIIHSLVKSHRNSGTLFDDIIRDKGKGLVGLLSGSPGVGKTLTAEVVAEVAKRPLYIVSAGELGTNVKGVDEQLGMVLDIARRWGCVVLIDEADVFLQARDTMDLERNAMVSIFLRRLEYFQGVLILTTNRKSAIDTAFRSRIHFKLNYPDLDEDSRLAVWKNLLDGVPPGVSSSDLNEDDIRGLAKMELDGRRIKNVVSCAFSIARGNNQPVTVEGIRMILDILD